MSWTVWAGLGAAVACALVGNIAALLKYRGARQAPPVQLSQPLRSLRALFRARPWALGFLVASMGWVCNALALALAPLSLVKPVLAAGVVLLAVVAERLLGLRPDRRQWTALTLAGGGLVAFALTAAHRPSSAAGAGLGWFALAAVAGAASALLVARWRSPARALAVGAGVLMGSGDVAVKQLLLTDPERWLAPAPLALGAALAALLLGARALQLGEAVGTVATICVVSNLVALGAGFAVFGDPLPEHPLLLVVNLAALAAVFVALALVPEPRRRV